MKKLMICVNLNDFSFQNIYSYLKDFDWKEISELHLINGFQLQSFTDGFYIDAYPLKEDYNEIKNSAMELLNKMENEILKNHSAPSKLQVIKKCIITDSPKDRISKYSYEQNIDIILIATKSKHGLKNFFHSSFAQYMISHTKSELRIIRGD